MERRWLNQAQPQTLQIAVFLLYINSAFLVLNLLLSGFLSPIYLAIVAGQVAAGYGIANERRWGYGLAIAMAFLPFLLRLALGDGLFGRNIINLMFEIALIALLLHPQSRDYQRIWFK
jgi:hypothetical protein